MTTHDCPACDGTGRLSTFRWWLSFSREAAMVVLAVSAAYRWVWGS